MRIVVEKQLFHPSFMFLQMSSCSPLSRRQWVFDWTMFGSDVIQINVELWKCWNKPAGFHKGLAAASALPVKATGFNQRTAQPLHILNIT